MKKEPGMLSLEETLDAARKQFLEEDLGTLDFEIEELENRLAFMAIEGGSDGCTDCTTCTSAG